MIKRRSAPIVESADNTMFHKGGSGKPRGFGFSGFALAAKKEDKPLGNSALGKAVPVPKLVKSNASKNNQSSFRGAASFPLPGARKP